MHCCLSFVSVILPMVLSVVWLKDFHLPMYILAQDDFVKPSCLLWAAHSHLLREIHAKPLFEKSWIDWHQTLELRSFDQSIVYFILILIQKKKHVYSLWGHPFLANAGRMDLKISPSVIVFFKFFELRQLLFVFYRNL